MRDIWTYKLLIKFRKQYYKECIDSSNLTGDGEMSISTVVRIEKKGDKEVQHKENKFFFPLKVDNYKYLLPSEWLDRLPLIIKDKRRKSHGGSGYWQITHAKSLKIKEQETMTYRELIDNWLPYEEFHCSPKELKMWKMIVECAYNDRINIRTMTYPGWMKDSPFETLRLTLGGIVSRNKPTFPRLKVDIAAQNKVIICNEMQNVTGKLKETYSGFYEDMGDLKSEFQNPSCSAKGQTDTTNIENTSTVTFYNVPKSPMEPIFDDGFDHKNNTRILPLFFDGGDQETNAVQLKPKRIVGDLSEEESDGIVKFMRMFLWCGDINNMLNRTKDKRWEAKYVLGSNRWIETYEAILDRFRWYSNTKEEFREWEELLYTCHKRHFEFLDNREQYCSKGITSNANFVAETEIIDLTKGY